MHSREKTVSRREFDKNINSRAKVCNKTKSLFITRAKYNKLLKQVKSARNQPTDEIHPKIAKLARKYDVITSDGVERLAVPNSTKKLIYISKDELFTVISKVHLDTGHGKLPEMTRCIKTKYKNIANEVIATYLKLCQSCAKKPPRKQRGAQKKESLNKEEEESKENKDTMDNKDIEAKNPQKKNESASECEGDQAPVKKVRRRRNRRPPESASTKPLTFGTRTPQRIDFIEMNVENNLDYEYNFIVVLRESTTKFVHLRPLRSRRPEELAEVLLPIFICFGTPSVLVTSNIDYIQSTLTHLSKYPTVPSDIRVEGTQETRFFADIETLMLSWVCENSTERWYNGLRFVQYITNLIFNKEILKTPFEAMFGRKGKLDVSNLNLPAELINDIRPAEDPEEEVKDVEINEMLEVVLNEDEHD